MPINIPTVTTSRMSLGPAIVFLGPAGTTPVADVGSIGDDGVELEVTSDFVDVMQGNPANLVARFVTAQNAMMRFNSIEWSVNQIGWTLGTGTTTITSAHEVLEFGGDPCPDNVAIYLQHRKACVAHTIFVRFWTATPETGSFSVKFDAKSVQNHAHAFKAVRSTTNWAGGALASDSQLAQIEIQIL